MDQNVINWTWIQMVGSMTSNTPHQTMALPLPDRQSDRIVGPHGNPLSFKLPKFARVQRAARGHRMGWKIGVNDRKISIE